MQRSTAERVASVPGITVEGVFHRHAALNRDSFAGGRDGRWGANLPVIYLGRPEVAPVAEATGTWWTTRGCRRTQFNPGFSTPCT